MSDQIERHRVLEFQGIVRHLLQQGKSRFRGNVMESGHTGKRAEAVRQYGAVAAVKKTARHADLATVAVPHERRWVTPQAYEFADFEDNADIVINDFMSSPEYQKALAMSLGRAIDDEIIEAATGTSLIGEDGATETEAFDTTNYQIASGSVGMTIDKLRAAMRKYEEVDLDMDDPDNMLFCALSPQEAEDLRNETQMISIDYNAGRILVDGKLRPFMGFNFIISNRLLDDGTDRSCITWAKSGLHLGIWNGIRTPVDWIPRMQAYQIAGVGQFGATRTEQGRVVNILCTK